MSEQRAPQQTGSELIAAERQRQIVKEGWTPEHDQTHQAGDLSQAGICYATMGNLQITMNINAAPVGVAKNWPWSRHWWKPANNPIRNLVKAGALIAAEIDRLLDDEPAASLPESQPSPSGDADSIEEIKGLFAMLNLGHLRAMETPNTDVIIAAAWLRSHDAKVSGQAEQRLIELVKAAVELAIVRHDLTNDGDDIDVPHIAEDIANAVRGIDTCAGEPIPEWVAALQESPSDTDAKKGLL